MKKMRIYRTIGKEFLVITSLFAFLITIIFASNIFIFYNNHLISENEFKSENQNYKSSLLWGWINFTNPELDGSSHFHGDSIIIEGRLFHFYTNISYQGYTVSVVDNGNLYSIYNDVTDNNGKFQILYDIPFSADIYSTHNITIEVTNPGGAIEFLNTLILNYRAHSYFEIPYPNIPVLTGEELILNGYLRYDNDSAIPNVFINYYWFDNSFLVDSNTILTDSDGYISSIHVPDIIPDSLSLKLNYSSTYVSYSERIISNPKIFSNITCIWDLPATAVEYNRYTIAGYLVSQTDNSILINDRAVIIRYNGTYIETVLSDSSGYFTASFNLPEGTGDRAIEIELENSIGKHIYASQIINVEAGSPPSPNDIPFLGFFLVFIPVLSGVIVGLIGYGYYYYRKQDKISRIVNLPLESRLVNLKILKDSGRLEESISYLFNGIYMELIKAKFGRMRADNETIRDFAIVSVKDLKLNPTSIYPFIQKIEEIIYAKPYQISDKHFYNTIELFSPVYFQLTGYNFELNF